MICAPSTGSETAILYEKNWLLQITGAHKIIKHKRICSTLTFGQRAGAPEYTCNTEKTSLAREAK